MISHRMRENRRLRALKLPKNIERLYKDGKCRDCSVVVTRMDFAKILGKFTKVKIQYESSSPKSKKNSEVTSPNSNARLKSNENGMVLIHRNAYSQHPVKELVNSNRKPKANQVGTPRQATNVLKENNRLKKTPFTTDKNSNINISSCNVNKKQTNSRLKQYGIVFISPTSKAKNVIKSKTTLASLLPLVDTSILPSDEWCIDYLPRTEEPVDDKVYDRIAAELEDLMYNEPKKSEDKPNTADSKVDDFPSIMDILNDNSSDTSKPNDQSTSIEFKANLESSDVEAMLLGKTTTSKELAPMEVDNTVMTNLIEDVAQLNTEPVVVSIPEIQQPVIDEFENPHSPSILDEALQKGIEEHLPCNPPVEDKEIKVETPSSDPSTIENSEESKTKAPCSNKTVSSSKSADAKALPNPSSVTHLIFKKNVNGKCLKSVTCPKNLKYSIELHGKTVEFLGAPNVISSLEDLQVLLQIVNETELQNLYVYH